MTGKMPVRGMMLYMIFVYLAYCTYRTWHLNYLPNGATR